MVPFVEEEHSGGLAIEHVVSVLGWSIAPLKETNLSCIDTWRNYRLLIYSKAILSYKSYITKQTIKNADLATPKCLALRRFRIASLPLVGALAPLEAPGGLSAPAWVCSPSEKCLVVK